MTQGIMSDQGQGVVAGLRETDADTSADISAGTSAETSASTNACAIAAARTGRCIPRLTARRTHGARRRVELELEPARLSADMQTVDSAEVHSYLRAFSLLQWWLLRGQGSNPAGRDGSDAAPYPEAYLHTIHSLNDPDMDELLDHYLDYNAARPRILDMLPLFARHDEAAVTSAVPEATINPRPAFRYRLPDCDRKEQAAISAKCWTRWCVVEHLATDPEAIAALTTRFCLDARAEIGVAKKSWIREIDQWIEDH